MNPIIASAVFGLIKGALAGRPPRHKPSLGEHYMGPMVMGPMYEEMMYRAMPHYSFGGMLPRGATATAFAADHIFSERKTFKIADREAAMRFADVFIGGLLYETAFRQSGYLGAVAAHALHNICCDLGSRRRR